jgi:hypothetical protein
MLNFSRRSLYAIEAATAGAALARAAAEAPPPSASTLYRRLIKLYIRRFDTDTETIVRAWKQTKFEFYHFRDAHVDDIPHLLKRGEMIYESLRGGIIPVVRDPKTGLTYCKYNPEILQATGGVIEPITVEDFVRRHHDKMSPEEREEIKAKLVAAGRWAGPAEFSPNDIPKMKVRRRKVKCTDPDEDPSAPAQQDTTSSSGAAAAAPQSAAQMVAQQAAAALKGSGVASAKLEAKAAEAAMEAAAAAKAPAGGATLAPSA